MALLYSCKAAGMYSGGLWGKCESKLDTKIVTRSDSSAFVVAGFRVKSTFALLFLSVRYKAVVIYSIWATLRRCEVQFA